MKSRRSFGTSATVKRGIIVVLLYLLAMHSLGQSPQVQVTVLRPARVFDGDGAHDSWVVIVRGDKIASVGPATSVNVPPDARSIDLPDMTLLPGLIEAHSHVLLHPYSETPWNDQVAHEPLALRVARATNHLRNTLLAGSQPFATWEPKAPATPMSVCGTPFRKTSYSDRVCSL